MKKFWSILAAVVIIAAGGIFYAKWSSVYHSFDYQPNTIDTTSQNLQKASDEQPIIPRAESSYVVYYGENGKNAFDLLEAFTKVEYKQYSFGVFVESINGVKPDDKHFWKLYYNGQEAQVGASQLQTKDGDAIEWKIEEIK
jgi:hypothetical protein